MERKIQIILYSSNNTITQDISNKEFPMLQLSNISNLGSLKQGSRKIVKLSFKNSGKSELHLKSVTATCPCISVQLKKNLFQPNESGIIYLLIQAEELKPGDYDFKLTIKSNMLENTLVKDFSFQVL
jgi:hypothetical protein